jgi:hypothetical protein
MMIENDIHNLNAGFQVADASPRYMQPLQSTPLQTPPLQRADTEPALKEVVLNAQNDLSEKYDRLNVRYKHILEERDALSKQVHDLRRQVEGSSSLKHDTVEEIKLLNKLLDEERALRVEAREKGALPTGYDAFARHEKFLNAFLSIVSRGEN